MRDFALEVFFSKWEFAAKHHLTASDAQSMPMSDLLNLASAQDRENFDKLWLGYTETQGAPDLRAVIANTYDTLDATHVQCFAGAEEGVYAAMQVLLGSDDHAIVVVPNYQAAETIPLSICEVSGVPLQEDQHWQLDLDDVRAAVQSNTKLISINCPNNPTGAIFSQEVFDGLIEICRQHDLFLFSDEVYRLLETVDDKRLPQVADAYEKGLSLNVMSKAYGLPGLRIGWIASKDTKALSNINRYKHYLSICNSAPSEHLAMIALKARDSILDRNRKIVRDNLQLLDVFLLNSTIFSSGRTRMAAALHFPAIPDRTASSRSANDWLRKQASCCYPLRCIVPSLCKHLAIDFELAVGGRIWKVA